MGLENRPLRHRDSPGRSVVHSLVRRPKAPGRKAQVGAPGKKENVSYPTLANPRKDGPPKGVFADRGSATRHELKIPGKKLEVAD